MADARSVEVVNHLSRLLTEFRVLDAAILDATVALPSALSARMDALDLARQAFRTTLTDAVSHAIAGMAPAEMVCPVCLHSPSPNSCAPVLSIKPTKCP